MKKGKITIGLFGTCGNSTWREKFIEVYSKKNINFFNPQKENWIPEDAEKEAEHLVNDDIIVFPVTGETYGCGSLAETGFSIMQAIRSDKNRFVIIFIENDLNEILKNDDVAYRESKRSRALALAHLKKTNHENVFIVSSLDDMLKVSLKLHDAVKSLKRAHLFCI